MTEEPTIPKLSVIIPVYNVLEYVQEAVDSILTQSVKPWEVIIVDDGSTDGSGDLVETLYGSHPLVKIIHTANGGLGEARNTGTRAATGDYIYYFDSDDISVDGLIGQFYQTLAQHPDMDLFAFSAESFEDPVGKSKGEAQSQQVRLISYRRRMERVFPSGEQAFNTLSETNAFIPNAWLYIYARKLQTQHQLFFLPIIHEDEEFTPRLFFVAGKTCVTDNVYFQRRIRIGSIMQSSRSEKNAIGYLRACDALEGLMQRTSVRESRKHLRARIVKNILNVIGVAKSAGVKFSAKSQGELDMLVSRYRNLDITLAENNYFAWRVVNFALKQLKIRDA
ncbi:glycosyltransferase family 2 protein [Mixta tenebrionis]|nr:MULTISPECIES: glycosyltransferase [Mixta]QHM74983.1 putative glycosyltransferase EpsJ [Mixta theicola]